MTINTINLKAFAMAEMDTYDLTGYRIDKNLALRELENEIKDEFIDLNDEETKRIRFERFKNDGVTREDFGEFLIPLDHHQSVICGIRHMNGNKDIPFINLRTNFKLSSKKEALEVHEQIKDRFALFKPLFLSFFNKDRIDADLYGDVYMCAKACEIKEKSPWESEADLEFVKIKDESYYQWYEAGYAQFNEDIPELAHKVRANSREIMIESLDEGLLHYVYYKGEKMGLIAVIKSDLLGSHGFYFNEIFIDKRFKGLGLAKAMQRKFISCFASEDSIVWGTIDANNLSSYKTAYSNGRRAIRFECFVKL